MLTQQLSGKRRHALRDQICVDEILAVRIIRQEFPGESRLTRPIWPCNDVNVWAHTPFGMPEQSYRTANCNESKRDTQSSVVFVNLCPRIHGSSLMVAAQS